MSGLAWIQTVFLKDFFKNLNSADDKIKKGLSMQYMYLPSMSMQREDALNEFCCSNKLFKLFNFACLFSSANLIFFQNKLFLKKIFQIYVYHQNVKQFGSRSGSMWVHPV